MDTAPCTQVIVTGDDVDLTALPLFLHHEHDGHAYVQDTSVVSKDPETGLINWGIYRMMFRTHNDLMIDMRNETHTARIHAKEYAARAEDMPVSIVVGGPTLDKIATMHSVPGVGDWDLLGGFYGAPAEVAMSASRVAIEPVESARPPGFPWSHPRLVLIRSVVVE